MAMPGRKPKPEDERRNRHAPSHSWVEVPDVPWVGPELPAHPSERKIDIPKPSKNRPLGEIGMEVWRRNYWAVTSAADLELLLLVAEQHDDRLRLRVQFSKSNGLDWRTGSALRTLEAQISANLARLGLGNDHASTRPGGWPEETKAWWAVVSTMPHCCLWSEADWQFATDTLPIAAAFHSGHMSMAPILQKREAVMGVTSDARRDLRIRYIEVEDVGQDEVDEVDGQPTASVSSLDRRRRLLTES